MPLDNILINKEKSNLLFSKLVPKATKNSIKVLLGVQEIKEYKKYLGSPVVVGRNKRANLNYIKDRVWKKLQGWRKNYSPK